MSAWLTPQELKKNTPGRHKDYAFLEHGINNSPFSHYTGSNKVGELLEYVNKTKKIVDEEDPLSELEQMIELPKGTPPLVHLASNN